MIKIGSYDYKGLVQSFFTQDRIQAKTDNNRMSYVANKIYSYNSLLGQLSTNGSNILYINKDIANYSKTSKKHTIILLHNLPNHINYFYIGSQYTLEESLQRLYWNEIENYIKKYKCAKITKDRWKQYIHELWDKAILFIELHPELANTKEVAYKDTIIRQLFVNRLLR